MYPMLKEGVSGGTFRYSGSDTIHYFIRNKHEEEYVISSALYEALFDADGTKPLSISDPDGFLLNELIMLDLVQTSRFIRGEGFNNRFIIFPLGDRLNRTNTICKTLNAVLPVASALVFAIGVYLLIAEGIHESGSYNWCLLCVIVFSSVLLHEIGHIVAGSNYGYRLSEFGILLFGIIPIGAYVAYRENREAKCSQKIQFSLAGIEVDLLLAGMCILFSRMFYSLSSTLIAAAIINTFLAASNLIPASGLDGESALSALFGVESISKTARRLLSSKKQICKLINAKVPGVFTLLILSAVLVSEIVSWIIIGLSFVGICLCIN